MVTQGWKNQLTSNVTLLEVSLPLILVRLLVKYVPHFGNFGALLRTKSHFTLKLPNIELYRVLYTNTNRSDLLDIKSRTGRLKAWELLSRNLSAAFSRSWKFRRNLLSSSRIGVSLEVRFRGFFDRKIVSCLVTCRWDGLEFARSIATCLRMYLIGMVCLAP